MRKVHETTTLLLVYNFAKYSSILIFFTQTQTIDGLLHGAQQRGVRRANAGSATLSAYVVAEHSCCISCTT